MTTTSNFLQLIESEMHRQGVRRSELARRMGVSRSAVSAMLQSHDLKISSVERLASALGCTVQLHLRKGS